MVKAKLLVVDDERVLLGLMTRKLERLSYEVKTADSGMEALEILQSQDIDVLITDFQMPGMTGSELIARAIKMDPILQSIVVTGYSDLKTAIDVMGAGAFNYLSKPVDFNELDVAIQKGLEKRQLLQDIQNKQKQLEEYRHHLEELVDKRTSALMETNQALEGEIEERKQLEISLREAKVLAENANTAKSEFLANMSHEIRTPLNGVIGMTELLKMTGLTDKQEKYVKGLEVSGNNLLSLINDILDLSKIEANKVKIEVEKFNLHRSINDVTLMQLFVLHEKGLVLEVDVAANVPPVLAGDQLRFKQILINLLGNAVKFTAQGIITISVQVLERHGDTVLLQISVRDTGIGIATEAVDKIFEPFVQENSSTTRQFGGTGLGLSISHRLAKLMNGSISVESTQGIGSCFSLVLPFLVTRQDVAEDGAQAETTVAWNGPPLHILLP